MLARLNIYNFSPLGTLSIPPQSKKTGKNKLGYDKYVEL